MSESQRIEITNTLPIFMQTWWLDAVCKEGEWARISVAQDGRDIGLWTTYTTKKKGFNVCNMPPMTPYLGPWLLLDKKNSRAKFYQQEKNVLCDLIKQLPKTDYFRQSFHPTITNGLPLFWEGYKQNTRFTYRLDTTPSASDILRQVQSNIRTDIKKAEEKAVVVSPAAADELWPLLEQTFARQNQPVPVRKERLVSIVESAMGHAMGQVVIAKNASGIPVAGALFLWDERECYYNLGGLDLTQENVGAMAAVLWYGIRLAKGKGLAFNFEGSMIPTIERFFRAFSGERVPYFDVQKTNAFTLKLRDAFRLLRT